MSRLSDGDLGRARLTGAHSSRMLPSMRPLRTLLAAALVLGALLGGADRASASRTLDTRRDNARRERQRDKGRGKPRVLPPVRMQHLTTHEQFVLRPDEGGHFGSKRLRGFRHFLRCHHTGKEHPMAPRLAELLYQTAHHFGDRAITVVAGYRAPKVAKAKGNTRSPHKKGVACDFRVDGVKVAEVRDYVRRTFKGVGVGYYPNSGFVHLDVGRKQSAFWIDYSGPGQRAEYASDPERDLRSGAAEAHRKQAPVEAGDDGAEEQGDGDGAAAADDPGVAAVPAPAAAAAPPRTPLE